MLADNSSANRYYFRQQKIIPLSANRNASQEKLITTKWYISKLLSLKVFSLCVLVLSIVLQVVAIATNDWFVLNVNEFIPTSKGGLWSYCYVINTLSYTNQFSCMRYEDLPNFFVFVTSRLYDSRILLLCGLGFTSLLVLIDLFGVISMLKAEKRGDLFDSFIAKRSSKLRAVEKSQSEYLYPSSPKITTKSKQSSRIHGNNGVDDATNSARFTTSIVVNANPEQVETCRTIKPTGYFAYLAIALITMVGSVMDFILKVSGFALFDAYVNSLLSFNRVFLAYRSYSYWMMIVSICLILLFWLFKVFSTRYVINITKRLLEQRDSQIIDEFTHNQTHYDVYGRTYNRDEDENMILDKYRLSNKNNRNNYQPAVVRSSVVYDIDANSIDGTATNAFSYGAPVDNNSVTGVSYISENCCFQPNNQKISKNNSFNTGNTRSVSCRNSPSVVQNGNYYHEFIAPRDCIPKYISSKNSDHNRSISNNVIYSTATAPTSIRLNNNQLKKSSSINNITASSPISISTFQNAISNRPPSKSPPVVTIVNKTQLINQRQPSLKSQSFASDDICFI